jgi:hypothetical protein
VDAANFQVAEPLFAAFEFTESEIPVHVSARLLVLNIGYYHQKHGDVPQEELLRLVRAENLDVHAKSLLLHGMQNLVSALTEVIGVDEDGTEDVGHGSFGFGHKDVGARTVTLVALTFCEREWAALLGPLCFVAAAKRFLILWLNNATNLSTS